MKNKVVFLDRDGTINVDKNYVYKIEDWEFEYGAIDALKLLQNLGFKLVVVSNQSGIGRGYYSKEDADKLFDYMKLELTKQGIEISGIYYCPHYNEECECRKPKLDMFYKAQEELNIDFSKSYAIGDKLRDVSICEKEDVKGFVITSEQIELKKNVTKCKTILEAAKSIEDIERKQF